MVASFEYIENTIKTFAQAAEANLNTPGRQGNIVVLTPELADDVMITGDLHGHRRNFNLIKTTAALEQHPRRHLVLQEACHGGPTYPQNGGCMSHTVLEDIARLKVRYPDRVHFILGNHELAEMTDYPIQKNNKMLNMLFRMGLQQMYGPAADTVRAAYMPFLKSCPLAVRLPHGVVITHSIPEKVDQRGFDRGVFTQPLESINWLDRGGVFQLVWGRDYREENARAFAELIDAQVCINGHEPCLEGHGVPNTVQVILDCCSEKAGFVILATDRPWTQADIVSRIGRLGA